jgi:hypothetical protein
VVRPWQERRKLNDSFTATTTRTAVARPQPVRRLRSQGKR